MNILENTSFKDLFGMPRKAIKSNWKTLDAPAKFEFLDYEHVFDREEASRLFNGIIPQSMEDKWFVYFEAGWLYFHRSWTGVLIYWIKLEETQGGFKVIEACVNRDTDQYDNIDLAHDRSLLDFLLRGLMLG